MNDDESYDVVVVGGGAAGLSGALLLGRSRRRVLVLDDGAPRNAPAAGVHGYLTRDGTPPAELAALARAEVERYGVELRAATVVSAAVTGDGERRGYLLALADGSTVRARRLLVTTGLVDELPDVPGLAPLWGSDVIHCPYCHGWEVRDEPIGVLATSPTAVHHALLFRQLSADVVLFTHTAPPSADDRAKLEAIGVRVVDGEVTGVESVDGRLTGVRVAGEDGDHVVPRRALAVAPRMVARGLVLTTLGIDVVEHPGGVGTHVPADPMGRTSEPGVWVAGNVADPMAQVVTAAATGAKAGAAINADLADEDARRAVASRSR